MYKHINQEQIYKRNWQAKKDWLTRRGYFRQLAHYSAGVVLIALVVAANIAIMPRARADGINAQHVIGQSDFTNGYPDAGSPNAHGFNQPGPTAYDPVHHRLFVADQNNNRVLVFNNTSGITDGMSASFVLGQPNFVSTSCPVDQSHFCTPSGLAYDSVNDRLFVADNTDDRVLIFDLSSGITNGMNASNVLGQPNFGLNECNGNVLLSISSMCVPNGLAYDSGTSSLFVADSDNNRILVYDLSGGITDGMAAVHVLGQTSFTANGCGHNQTGVCFPEDINYDSVSDSLFVADTSNDRALMYDLSGGITDGMPASHEFGQPDFNGHSCLNGQNGMCNVDDITYDSGHHYLIVSDTSNFRIMIYDLSGTITDGMNAVHVLGQNDFNGTSCLASITDNNICYPVGMAYDLADQQLFVGDSERNRMLDFNFAGTLTDGMAAVHVLGQADFVSSMANGAVISAAGLDNPFSSVYDSVHDRLFVADNNNNRILVYDTSSGINNGMAASHVLGQTNFTNNSCSLAQNGLCNPDYMAYDSVNNRLFVGEEGSNRVVVYDLSGGITDGMNANHILGQTSYSDSDCNQSGSASDSTLCNPDGLTYDSGNQLLFVADAGNNRILVYDLSGGITDDMPAVHELGDSDFIGTAAVDSDSYMSDPSDLTYDSSSHSLFVADYGDNRVMIFDLSSGITDGMPAVHELGQPDFNSFNCNGPDAITSASTLCFPGTITYDSANQRLFVGDNNNRVLTYDLSGGITDGMPATGIIGQDDFSTSQANCYSDPLNPPNQSNFCNQPGLYYDNANGILWATDSGNSRVLAFGPAVAILTSTLPNGLINSAYSAPLAIAFGQAPFTFSITAGSLPAGVNLDPGTGAISGTPTAFGNFSFTVKVTDNNGGSDSKALTIVISNGSNGYNASGLLGQTDFNSDGPNQQNVSASSLSQNSSATTLVDAADHLLFIADSNYNRVLVYNLNPDGTPVDSMADYVLGQTNFTSTDCATLCNPGQMAIDIVHHHLYVTNGSVEVFNLNTNNTPSGNSPVYTFAIGGDGGCSFSPSIHNPEADSLCYVDGVAVDTTNHLLYISDNGYNRVLGFQLDNNNMPIDSTADYVIGQPDFTSWQTNAGGSISADGLSDPAALNIDNANHLLYVVDANNYRVLGYSLNSNGTPVDGTADYVVGQSGFTSGNFNFSCGGTCLKNVNEVAIDSTNHIMYISTESAGIFGYNLNTNDTPISSTADYVLGEPDTSTYGCNYPNGSGFPTTDNLCQPLGLSIDNDNHRLWIADTANLRALGYNLNSDGTPQDGSADYVLGQPNFTSSYFNGVAPSASGFDTPNDTVLDPVGHHLYVSDYNNNRVLIFDLDSSNHIINSAAASYVLGELNFTNIGCEGEGVANCLSGPDGIALNSVDHVLYVSESSAGRIVAYQLDSNNVPLDNTPDFVFGAPDINSIGCTGTVCSPTSLAVDGTNHILYEVDDSTESVLGFDLDSNGGPVDAGPDYNLNSAILGSASIALDTTYHLLYVGNDIGHSTHQVLVYKLDASNKPTNGVPIDAIDNQTNSNCDGQIGFAANDQLCWPDALAIDPVNHRLFVFDEINSDVQVYNLDDNDMPLDQIPDAVIGQPSINAGEGCNQGLEAPTQYTLCGQFGIDGDDEQFYYQRGAQYDPATHQLFITDDADGFFSGNNNRLLSYEFAQITTNSLQGGTSGSSYTQAIDETGSQGSVSYSLQGGSLPPGIALDSATGILSGTPTAGGTYNFTIGLADDNGAIGIFNDSKVLSLTVTAVTPPTPPVTPPVTPPTPPKKPKPPVTPTAPPPSTPTPTVTPPATTIPAPPINQPLVTPVIQHQAAPIKKHAPPSVLRFIFPWLLFILLGLLVARLSYLSYQERKLAGELNRELAEERQLSEEKNNFLTLSSHYLRTPMTLISNGIDLIASTEADNPAMDELKILAAKLNLSVNALLYQTGNSVTDASPTEPNHVISPWGSLRSAAAGFVQVSSMPTIVVATLASMLIIGIANLILSRIDIYNVSLISLLTELAAALLLGVMALAGLHSYNKRKRLRQETQDLLDHQRRLDDARNQLVKVSLDNLVTPLQQLKAKLQPLAATNPKLAGPVLEGVKRLEDLLQKFVILTSLQTGAMGLVNQPSSLNDLVQKIQQRYEASFKNKNLSLKTDLQSDSLKQDPLLLRFVVDSLVNNAVKYSPEQSQIGVSSRNRGNNTEIYVSDAGPGIDQDKQAQLFQAFSRSEDVASDFNQEGLGLSLYLDKLVMRYLGGSIELLPQANSGTTVRLVVPA